MTEFTLSFQAELAAWLASGYGLDLGVFGQGAMAEALGVRCRAIHLDTPETYAARWREDAGEREALLDELVVGETWFFREWSAFQMLGAWLAAQGTRFSAVSPLRVLALPCATGEEAWSIAAIAREAGLDSPAIVIEAMDINHSALQFAGRGRYSQRRLRSQPVSRWAHVLHPIEGDRLEVDASLRAMVRFIEANAMDRQYLLGRGPYHVIFCRNMLIYMSSEARSQVCDTLAACLAPDGLLFLGHAEQVPAGLGLIRTGMEGAFAWRLPAAEVQVTRPAALLPRLRESRGRPAAVPSARTLRRRAAPPVTRPTLAAPALPPPASRPELAGGQTRARLPGVDLEEARQLANQGRYLEALQALDSTEARASLDPEVHGLAGVLLGALDRKGEAMTRLRRALYLDPAHAESLAHLALLIEESGDVAAASRLRARLTGQKGVTGL